MWKKKLNILVWKETSLYLLYVGSLLHDLKFDNLKLLISHFCVQDSIINKDHNTYLKIFINNSRLFYFKGCKIKKILNIREVFLKNLKTSLRIKCACFIWWCMYRLAPSYAAFTTTNANNIHSAVLGASYNYLVRPAELTNVYMEFVIFSINSVVCRLSFLSWPLHDFILCDR